MKLLPITLCITLSPLSLTAVMSHAQLPEIKREIADFDRQIHQNRERVQSKEKSRGPLDDETKKNQAALAELERRLSPVTIGLEGLKLNTQKAKNLLDMAVSNPELVDSQKLEALHRDYRAALVNQSQRENEARLLSKELDGYRTKAEDLKRQKKALEIEIETLNRDVLSLTLKKPVIVEAEGECIMHDDITPKACKEQALLRAKQNAIETGGTSLVRSLTEVSKDDIVKDEISVKTLAKIRHLDILQPPQLVAQGELGKYIAKIRAVVESQVPDIQSTAQMAQLLSDAPSNAQAQNSTALSSVKLEYQHSRSRSNVLAISFTVSNDNARVLSTYTITCKQYGATGKYLGNVSKKIYGNVQAKGKQDFTNLEMGLLDSQTERVTCEAVDLVIG